MSDPEPTIENLIQRENDSAPSTVESPPPGIPVEDIEALDLPDDPMRQGFGPDEINTLANRSAIRDQKIRGDLAAAGFDGPYDLGGGLDPIMVALNTGHHHRFAICVRCGVMVALADPTTNPSDPDGPDVERGILLHAAEHERVTGAFARLDEAMRKIRRNTPTFAPIRKHKR